MYDVGTEVYYTGDVANQDGFGTVVNVRKHFDRGQWDYSYDLHFPANDSEGERTFKGIYQAMFDGAPGRRFMLKSEYDADKAAKLATMRANYHRIVAEEAE